MRRGDMQKAMLVLAVMGLTGPASATEARVTLAVTNMTCATCPIAVRTAIRRVAGVKAVEVDFDHKTALVVYDDALVNPDTLAAASRDAGFPATRKG